jgi:hypothetical protein
MGDPPQLHTNLYLKSSGGVYPRPTPPQQSISTSQCVLPVVSFFVELKKGVRFLDLTKELQ